MKRKRRKINGFCDVPLNVLLFIPSLGKLLFKIPGQKLKMASGGEVCQNKTLHKT